jgi:hypothetical protein
VKTFFALRALVDPLRLIHPTLNFGQWKGVALRSSYFALGVKNEIASSLRSSQ